MGSKNAKKKPAKSAKKKPAKSTKAGAPKDSFPAALAELLRSRKIKVPSGLLDAPAEAYARQPASVVETLATLDDDALRAQAEKVATYAARQEKRARDAWDTSPLIAELRRRKLKEPARPTRVVGAAFSLKKPLREWSDAEILDVAGEWSKRGR